MHPVSAAFMLFSSSISVQKPLTSWVSQVYIICLPSMNFYVSFRYGWTLIKYLMFCIKIEHKSSCSTKIIICQIMLIIFLLNKFMANFILRYCKDIVNLLFWEFWECLIIPIKNHSINLYGIFMLICMQKINFIIHFFLNYCKK